MHLKLRKLLALCMTGVMMISSGLSSFPIYAAEPSPSVTIENEVDSKNKMDRDGSEIWSYLCPKKDTSAFLFKLNKIIYLFPGHL